MEMDLEKLTLFKTTHAWPLGRRVNILGAAYISEGEL
jgi:hypothetical protein